MNTATPTTNRTPMRLESLTCPKPSTSAVTISLLRVGSRSNWRKSASVWMISMPEAAKSVIDVTLMPQITWPSPGDGGQQNHGRYNAVISILFVNRKIQEDHARSETCPFTD